MAMHTELAIYNAASGLLYMATNLTRNIPRDLKQSLGKRVIDECIDIMMLIARANATRDRRPFLTELVEKVQVIEFLMRLFKENRFISVPRELLDAAAEWLEHLSSPCSAERTVAEDLRALLAKPAAQPQGEPVCEVKHGPFDDAGEPQWVRVITLGDYDLEHIPHGTKLYTSPPAQAAVVLPEHRDTDLRSPSYGYARGWNACLDEVARLNK